MEGHRENDIDFVEDADIEDEDNADNTGQDETRPTDARQSQDPPQTLITTETLQEQDLPEIPETLDPETEGGLYCGT